MIDADKLSGRLWPEIDAQVQAHAAEFAFLEARVSAESFVRDHAAIAAHRAAAERGFRVRLEKKVAGKKVDLLVTQGEEDPTNDNTILIELKMAWPGTWRSNANGVARDLELLRGRPAAYALVAFFAFTAAPSWAPYVAKKSHPPFEEGLRRFTEQLDHGQPLWRGKPFSLSTEETAGEAVLLVWQA